MPAPARSHSTLLSRVIARNPRAAELRDQHVAVASGVAAVGRGQFVRRLWLRLPAVPHW